jgi:hypothetical protein
MTDSVGGGGPEPAGPDDADRERPPRLPSFTPSTHPVTEAAAPGPTHPPTELAPRPTDEVAWDRTATAPGSGSRSGPGPGPESPAASADLYRRGPGVPAVVPGRGQPVPTAEEVWRSGLPPGQSPGSGHGPGRSRWRRRAGSALTVALLIAVAVVVFLRLHHAALRVTGVAITSQAKDGCSVDVTGRISTTGGAGTVSYQWLLTPQSGAPRPLSQTVTAGQSTIYVTAAIQGTSQLSRQVTLQVLSPGQGSATAHVDANC